MSQTIPSPSRRCAVLSCLGAVVAPLTAWAQPRPAAQPYRARLIGGALDGDGRSLMVGLHLQLDRGWKTYWRTPGDSGIAPSFDWRASGNLRAARVLFPAPARFSDGFGEILGYDEEVVFPVRLTAQDPAQAIDARLKFDFGVCERVCVPASVTLNQRFGQASPAPADMALIQRHLARVPRAVPTGTAISDWSMEPGGQRLAFSAQLPGGVQHVAVEGPQGFAIPMTRLQMGGGGRVRVRVNFDRPVPPPLRQAPLVVTIVGVSQSVEETRSLD